MNQTQIVDIVRGVHLSTLYAMTDLPPELTSKVEAMMSLGATVVDVATVLAGDGYSIVIMPEESDLQESHHMVDMESEDDMEPESPEMYDDEEDDRGGLVGLLDRLRAVFGKAVSFEHENAMIARNRKRASARAPHDFQRAVWATRKGTIRCRICGGPSPVEGQLCAGITLKDMGEMGDEGMAIGDLTIRSATVAQAYDMIADTLGCWSPHEAHYMDDNPFVDDGLACMNCVAYCAETAGCWWVEGPILPDGLCKLWVIPETLQKTIEPVEKADTYTPPQGVQDEATRAQAWIADGQAGGGFTATGRRRASDLAAGNPVSLDTIKRMASYLARHAVDKQGEGWSPGESGYPSPGRVAWAAWGGDPAVSWTRSILDSVEKGDPTVSEVHVDVPMGSGGRQKKKPVAIPSVFAKADERRFTLGPWYVPDAYDAHGEWTDATELQSALWDYVRNSDRQIRLQHNVDVVAGEWVEAMTWPYAVNVPMLDVETNQVTDHEFPANTVFMGVVWEPWAWDLVKAGKIRGYSMGGNGQRVTVDLTSDGQLRSSLAAG